VSERPLVIDLYIEELVLHGVNPADRHRIGDTIERELARLMRERGLPPVGTYDGNIPRLDGGVRPIASAASGTTVGNQIARAVYEGLDQ
jgi:hypothetical protein